jgi:hypothetical protein
MTEDPMQAGWSERAKHRASATEAPSGWPKNVKPISLEGLSFLGINAGTNELYWNGQQVQTRAAIRLEGATFVFVAMTGISTFGLFVVEVLRGIGVFQH